VVLFLGLGLTDTGESLNDRLGGGNSTTTETVPKEDKTEQNSNNNSNNTSVKEDKEEDKGSIFSPSEKVLQEGEAIVSRVIDGDTILAITDEGKEERVRLLLIDTPESVHPDGLIEEYGVESSDYAKEYLKQGDKIYLEVGENPRDKYDRLLAHVWVDDVNFNLHMVEQGYARVAYVYEPNTKYVDEFRSAEQKAKSKGLNIWSIDGYVTDKGFDMSVVP